MPPVIFAGEQRLRDQLSAVAEGKAFLLQGVDCPTSFAEFSASNTFVTVSVCCCRWRLFSPLAAMPVVKIGKLPTDSPSRALRQPRLLMGLSCQAIAETWSMPWGFYL